jgi:tRNA threonylcarbamoyladenosine biosynthesis protein TsaE
MSPEAPWCAAFPDAAAARRFGACLGRAARAGDVVALEGPLGVGKTTLVQGVAEGLGLGRETPVTSPSFTLVGEYPTEPPLRHADLYRVESERRLDDAGFDDLFDGRGLVVVEWADRFPRALPADRLCIQLEFERESCRLARVRALGPRAEALSRRLHETWH